MPVSTQRMMQLAEVIKSPACHATIVVNPIDLDAVEAMLNERWSITNYTVAASTRVHSGTVMVYTDGPDPLYDFDDVAGAMQMVGAAEQYMAMHSPSPSKDEAEPDKAEPDLADRLSAKISDRLKEARRAWGERDSFSLDADDIADAVGGVVGAVIDFFSNP